GLDRRPVDSGRPRCVAELLNERPRHAAWLSQCAFVLDDARLHEPPHRVLELKLPWCELEADAGRRRADRVCFHTEPPGAEMTPSMCAVRRRSAGHPRAC